MTAADSNEVILFGPQQQCQALLSDPYCLCLQMSPHTKLSVLDQLHRTSQFILIVSHNNCNRKKYRHQLKQLMVFFGSTSVNLAVGTDLQGLRTLCCWSPCPLSPSAGGDRMGETTCWEVKGDTYLNICSVSPPDCRTICGAVSPLRQKQNYRKVYNEILNYIINQVESVMMSYKDRIQITAANRSLITAGCLVNQN